MHWTTNHNASMVHGWIAASIGKVTKFRNQPLLFDTPLVISSTTECLVEQMCATSRVHKTIPSR